MSPCQQRQMGGYQCDASWLPQYHWQMVSSLMGRWSYSESHRASLFGLIAMIIRLPQATQAIQRSLLTCLIWTTLRLDPPPERDMTDNTESHCTSSCSPKSRKGGIPITQRPITRGTVDSDTRWMLDYSKTSRSPPHPPYPSSLTLIDRI